MHVPGKIESNIVIIDLGNISLLNIPIKAVQNLLNV